MHHHSEAVTRAIDALTSGGLPTPEERETTEEQLRMIEKITGWVRTHGISDRAEFERTVMATVTEMNRATADDLLRRIVWRPAAMLMERGGIDLDAVDVQISVGWDVLTSLRTKEAALRKVTLDRRIPQQNRRAVA